MIENYDYIIVGAGIIGITLAARLREKGHSVLILEQYDLGGGASGGNLGQISLMDRFEPWHLKLAFESLDYYSHYAKKGAIEYKQQGGTILLRQDNQIERTKEVAMMQKSGGLNIALLDASEAQRLEPNLDINMIKAVAFCEQEGRVEPLHLLYHMVDRFMKAGGEIHTKEKVISFKTHHHQIEAVETTRATYKAKMIINATGGWAGQLSEMLGESLPIRHHKGTALVTQPLPSVINTTLVGGGFLMSDTGASATEYRVGTALCQHQNGSLILGQATEQSLVDERDMSVAGISDTAANALQYFPILSTAQIIRAWAVSTAYSADDLPVLGFSRRWDNLFTVAGFKGAFTTAPAVARVASEMLLTGESFEPSIEPRKEGEFVAL